MEKCHRYRGIHLRQKLLLYIFSISMLRQKSYSVNQKLAVSAKWNGLTNVSANKNASGTARWLTAFEIWPLLPTSCSYKRKSKYCNQWCRHQFRNWQSVNICHSDNHLWLSYCLNGRMILNIYIGKRPVFFITRPYSKKSVTRLGKSKPKMHRTWAATSVPWDRGGVI